MSAFRTKVTHWDDREQINLKEVNGDTITKMTETIKRLMRSSAFDMMTIIMTCHDIIITNFNIKVTINDFGNDNAKCSVSINCEDCISL